MLDYTIVFSYNVLRVTIMASNVYTKNEILQNLASKGYFIDAYTLDTFFEKWKVEAIFEDEQGCEFYDTNALDLVLENLFNASSDQQEEELEEPRVLKAPEPKAPEVKPVQAQTYAQPQVQTQPQVEAQQPFVQPQIIYNQPPQPMYQQPYIQPQMQQPYIQPQMQQPQMQQAPYQQPITNDAQTNKILSNISLSDGTPLINKVQDNNMDYIDYNAIEQEAIADIQPADDFDFGVKKEKKMGILEGAMLATGQEYVPEETTSEEAAAQNEENPDFDDISLLSESLEAQEKFREYVVSELSRKNVDLTPKNNEFKLDISERTLNMIAKTMAKKIASHVNKIYSGEVKNSAKFDEIQEKNKKLETRTKELEDQNKKLRLLLAESNKNLNSYKPSFFGLYKKVPPTQ